MDPLLLLCNLHAEGPATWRRLRARGIARPAELAALPIDRLAEWLGGSPAAARRFLREAERITRSATAFEVAGESAWHTQPALDAVLDAGPPTVRATSAPTPVRGAVPGSRDERASAHAGARVELARATLPAALPAALPAPAPRTAPTVAAPRTAARESLPARTTLPADAPARALSRLRALPLDELAPRSALPSTKVDSPLANARIAGPLRPAPADAETLLHPGRLAGLDLAACQKLIGAGLRTWDDLRRIPALRIAAATGIRAEALRAWQAGADAPESEETERVHVLHPRPRAAPPTPVWRAETPLTPRTETVRRPRAFDLEDVAGPFA
ncbi:MAG: hypothetical protein IPJ77_02025 [Planctomycetes bacterium]|nr:hypothetical protein [Planctomycetota bacterium]